MMDAAATSGVAEEMSRESKAALAGKKVAVDSARSGLLISQRE